MYSSYKSLGIFYFNIKKGVNYYSDTYYSFVKVSGWDTDLYNWDTVYCIKSDVTPARNKILFCLYKSSLESNCII